MPLETVEITGALPFDLEAVKNALRIDSDEDDETLSGLVADAVRQCENITRRTIRGRKYRYSLPRFDETEIELPKPKAIAVESIRYRDAFGEIQVLDPSLYELDAASEPAVVYPADGESWPMTRARRNAVEITYTAGYQDGDEIPDCIFTAVCMYVSAIIEDRPVPFEDMSGVLAEISLPGFVS